MRRKRTDEADAQFVSILRLSLLLGAVCSLAALFWGIRAFLGVWAGDLMCLAGFMMIRAWCFRGSFSKVSGFKSQTLRYCFYGLVIALCLWQQVPVLSLVAGIAVQKAAIVICPLLGKEDVHGACKRH